MRLIISILMTAFFLFTAIDTYAKVLDDQTFQSSAQEIRYQALIEEFRCPKCQNASLAGSDAPIAQDLRNKTYSLVKQGHSDEQIRLYMTSRYGNFISYNPPINRATWVLWFTPFLLLLLALFVGLIRMRSRRNLTVIPLNAVEIWGLNQVLSNQEVNTQNIIDQDMRHDR
jgi:cytochrome c-type biogenesis protein CcmH